MGDAAFVTEMQKRIGKEKDGLNIPQQQKRPIAKPLSEIAAQPKTAKQRSLPPTKPAHTANEKSASTINCTRRRLGLLFGRTRILDSGSDRVSVTPFCVNFAIALSHGRTATATGNHYAVLVDGDQWRPHSADKTARSKIFLQSAIFRWPAYSGFIKNLPGSDVCAAGIGSDWQHFCNSFPH